MFTSIFSDSINNIWQSVRSLSIIISPFDYNICWGIGEIICEIKIWILSWPTLDVELSSLYKSPLIWYSTIISSHPFIIFLDRLLKDYLKIFYKFSSMIVFTNSGSILFKTYIPFKQVRAFFWKLNILFMFYISSLSKFLVLIIFSLTLQTI